MFEIKFFEKNPFCMKNKITNLSYYFSVSRLIWVKHTFDWKLTMKSTSSRSICFGIITFNQSTTNRQVKSFQIIRLVAQSNYFHTGTNGALFSFDGHLLPACITAAQSLSLIHINVNMCSTWAFQFQQWSLTQTRCEPFNPISMNF